MVDISGPHWVNQGEKVTLICRYDLGRDAIYSMKWFKGDQEVYRYVPTDQPEYKYFNAPGIIVDVSIGATSFDQPSLSQIYNYPIQGKKSQPYTYPYHGIKNYF